MALKSSLLSRGFSKHFTESQTLLSWYPGKQRLLPSKPLGFVKIPPSPSAWLLGVSVSPGQPRGRGLTEEHSPEGGEASLAQASEHQLLQSSPAFLALPAPSSALWGGTFILNPAVPTLAEQEGSCPANPQGE